VVFAVAHDPTSVPKLMNAKREQRDRRRIERSVARDQRIRLDQIEIRQPATSSCGTSGAAISPGTAGRNIPGIMIFERNESDLDRPLLRHAGERRVDRVYGGTLGAGRPTNVTLSVELIADATRRPI